MMACILCVASAALLSAATLRVSPDGTGADGLTWESAFRTINEALAAASGPTDIWTTAGTYTDLINTSQDNIHIYGGFAGDETNLAERHGGATVIDGGNAVRPLRLTSAHNWVLDSLVVRRGSAFGFGGAVYALNCTALSMKNVVIEDSTSSSGNSGGGIYASGGSLIMTDCTIQRCTSLDTGGGIRAIGTEIQFTRVVFADCTGVRGGGLALEGGGGFATECLFRHNTATSASPEGGGGAWLKAVQQTPFTKNFFTQNIATYGSALDANGGTVNNFYNNVFNRNQSGTATIIIRGLSTWPRFLNNNVCDNTSTAGNTAYRLLDHANALFRNENICYNTGPAAAVGREITCLYSWAYANFYQNSVGPFTDPADLVAAGSTTSQSNPRFINRQLLDDPFSYQIPGDSPIRDLGYDEVKDDFGGADRPIDSSGYALPYPDKGCFEFQDVSQFVTMLGWAGPTNNGDQASVLLRYTVKDNSGNIVVSGSVPQSTTGFYVLRGQGLGAGEGPYRILVSAPGYLQKAIDLVALPAYGSPGVSVTILAGDTDGDNTVGVYDLNAVLTAFTDTGPSPADVNGNRQVEILDMNSVMSNFGLVGDN